MASRSTRNGNVNSGINVPAAPAAPVSGAKVLRIVDGAGSVIGTIAVDGTVKLSQPKENGKGGGKEYITAEIAVDFGGDNQFGGKVTLWEPRTAAEVGSAKTVVRSF